MQNMQKCLVRCFRSVSSGRGEVRKGDAKTWMCVEDDAGLLACLVFGI